MADPAAEPVLTGDDIIAEILRNAEASLFKVRYTTLVPSVFNVYLSRRDYDQIAPVASFVAREAKQALRERLESLNSASKPSGIAKKLGLGGQAIQYKVLGGDFAVEFHADSEDRLGRGEIEIYSELGSAEETELGSGAMTTFITRRGSAGETARAEPVSSGNEAGALAYIRYEDRTGAKTFPVTKALTVIGRGGKSFWVDLRVEGPSDVSREHCRLRYDEASGRFFLKDVSQYGTTVNGERIPSSMERPGGGAEPVDRNVEAPLPARARIGLADVYFLEFEASA
ncbi:MAG: FHA domain-containing protein [Bryobacteraceae bacterium]|nr:FHA domain-containing protein [Bryobacteraceae bacterium]